MKREMDGQVLFRLFCDACRREGRARQGELGQIVTLGDGAPSWYTQNPRRPHPTRGRFGMWAAQVLRHREFSNLDLPDDLPAYCLHHGWRRIATSELFTAWRSGRRTGVLTSWAVV